MTKYILKRIKRSGGFEFNQIDDKFVNGSISRFPDIGESLVFAFSRLNEGQWITSPITAITELHKKKLIILETKNSTYHMKKGWI